MNRANNTRLKSVEYDWKLNVLSVDLRTEFSIQ